LQENTVRATGVSTAAPRPPSEPPVRPTRRRGGKLRLAGRILAVLIILFVDVPLAQVIVYAVVPPPITILMITRLIQGHGMDYRWRGLNQISPALPRAAVASEDARFCAHHGFDFQAMEKALRQDQRRPNRLRGGSTISQQTAKNVFLWPGRDYVRKAIEAWYTVLIEAVWGKRRIMEMYLNVVEFGPGVYGAEAASQRYFNTSASALNDAQAARLVAVLPKPLSWSAADPGRYIVRRTLKIDGRMVTVEDDDLAACVGR
jgi:monofunctional biosynthetic peptidoglycan transglycosylase